MAAQELPLNTMVPTNTNKIDVIGPNNAPLPPGKYVFQLVVVDSLEIPSDPVQIEVTVAGTPKVRLTVDPASPVPLGRPFTLVATAESPNGAIKTFQWTRMR